MKKLLFSLSVIFVGFMIFLAPGFAQDLPTFTVNSHIQDYGWRTDNSDSNHHILFGTFGEAKRIEAFELAINYPDLGIAYDAHVQDIGWQGTRNGPTTSGTVGMAKQIEGMYFVLIGPNADQFDLYYRTHVQNYGWLDWAKNGQLAGTTNHFYRCEAVEMIIVPKGSPGPGSTATPMIEANSRVEAQHINLVNNFRKSHGLGYVSGNAALKKVCDARLLELPVKVSHTRPDGRIYETIVKDVFPNYPTPGGGIIESFIFGRTSYANPGPAFDCYSAYPHMMDLMLDPAIRYMSWSGRVSGSMGYSLELFSGLDTIDFDKY